MFLLDNMREAVRVLCDQMTTTDSISVSKLESNGKGWSSKKLVPVMFYVKAVFRISCAGMPETKPHLSFCT